MEPVLFYTIGYPGSGKTTLARSLATWLGAVHLRGDTIGLELFRFPTYSPEERRIVYEEMARRGSEQLQAGRPVLYDATTNVVAQRQALHTLAQASHATAVGLWLQAPMEVTKKRAGTARDAGIVGQVVRIIPPHIFEQYVAAFEAPAASEHAIVVPGDMPFYHQYRHLYRQLRARGIHLPRLI